MAVDPRARDRNLALQRRHIVGQQPLFEDERRQPGYEHPPMSGRQLLPENWLKRSDVAVHSSWSPTHPMEGAHPTESSGEGKGDNWATSGIHYGTEAAATEKREEGYLHAARILHNAVADNPDRATYRLDNARSTYGANPSTDLVGRDEVWWDDDANRKGGQAKASLDAGKAIPYANLFEDSGSLAYRVPDAAKRTWEQDVASANRPEFNQLVGGRNLIGRGRIRDAVSRGDMDINYSKQLPPGRFQIGSDRASPVWALHDATSLKDMTPSHLKGDD